MQRVTRLLRSTRKTAPPDLRQFFCVYGLCREGKFQIVRGKLFQYFQANRGLAIVNIVAFLDVINELDIKCKITKGINSCLLGTQYLIHETQELSLNFNCKQTLLHTKEFRGNPRLFDVALGILAAM